MHLRLRLLLSLLIGITLIDLVSAYYQERATRRELKEDLGRRAEILDESLADKVVVRSGASQDLLSVVERFGNRPHSAGAAACNRQGYF